MGGGRARGAKGRGQTLWWWWKRAELASPLSNARHREQRNQENRRKGYAPGPAGRGHAGLQLERGGDGAILRRRRRGGGSGLSSSGGGNDRILGRRRARAHEAPRRQDRRDTCRWSRRGPWRGARARLERHQRAAGGGCPMVVMLLGLFFLSLSLFFFAQRGQAQRRVERTGQGGQRPGGGCPQGLGALCVGVRVGGWLW
jgi:hypothetical protein